VFNTLNATFRIYDPGSSGCELPTLYFTNCLVPADNDVVVERSDTAMPPARSYSRRAAIVSVFFCSTTTRETRSSQQSNRHLDQLLPIH
jgi:hypothetical protein